jgi:hypothetical protein
MSFSKAQDPLPTQSCDPAPETCCFPEERIPEFDDYSHRMTMLNSLFSRIIGLDPT